jgi:hypothetical protein
MEEKIEVDLSEVLRLYAFMEELVAFFHQPLHYQTIEDVQRFIGNRDTGAFSKMSEMYYQVLWDWLPEEEKEKIQNQ